MATLPDDLTPGIALHGSRRRRGWEAGEAVQDVPGAHLVCLRSRRRVSAHLFVLASTPVAALAPWECQVGGERVRVLPVRVPSVHDPAPIELGVTRVVRYLESEEGRWLRLPEDRWRLTTSNAEAVPWTLPKRELTTGRCFVRRDAEGQPWLWFGFPARDGKVGVCWLPREGLPDVPVSLEPREVSVRGG